MDRGTREVTTAATKEGRETSDKGREEKKNRCGRGRGFKYSRWRKKASAREPWGERERWSERWRERWRPEGDAAEQEMEWSKMDLWTPVKATAQSIMADRDG